MHSDECQYIYLYFLQNIFLFHNQLAVTKFCKTVAITHNQLAVTKFCKTVAITGKMFSIDLFTDTAAILNKFDLRSIIGCPGGMSTFCLYFRVLFGTFFLKVF